MMSKRIRIRAVLAAAALVAGLAQTAAADTTLTYRSAEGSFTVDMRPGAVRIDDASEQWQLYRRDSEAIFSVRPDERTYTRLDRDVADTIRQRMDTLRAEVETRVQQLPEGQRAAARAALVDQIPGLEPSQQSDVGLDHTGQTETVAGVECEIVQIVRDGQPGETLCLASADALGVDDDTFATIKSMFALMKTMLAGTGLETVGLPYLDLDGMPVRFRDAGTGERRVLSSISHEPLGDGRFSIPDDYIEQTPAQPGR